MGLIDADKLMQDIRNTITEQSNTIDWLNLINRQPIAYNVDAVVKQLEERTAFLKDCKKYDNETAEQQKKSYDTMMMYEVKDLVDDLIRIVRGGGVDA